MKSLIEILNFFGIDRSVARTLTQSQIIYLIRLYYNLK